MATLKSEVNTSRLIQGHISSESVCDNGIGTFAISSRGYQQLPGVQEVRVRHFMCQGSVQNFLTKSNRNFEVKKKPNQTFDGDTAADSTAMFDGLHTSLRSNETKKHFRFS